MKINHSFNHERAKENKKRLLASVLFFKKTLQNKVTLEGTFHTHEGSLKGFLA
ncbi:Ss-DNA-specific exonuclease RecJ [Priestia megaterium]